MARPPGALPSVLSSLDLRLGLHSGMVPARPDPHRRLPLALSVGMPFPLPIPTPVDPPPPTQGSGLDIRQRLRAAGPDQGTQTEYMPCTPLPPPRHTEFFNQAVHGPDGDDETVVTHGAAGQQLHAGAEADDKETAGIAGSAGGGHHLVPPPQYTEATARASLTALRKWVPPAFGTIMCRSLCV